jgi:predicted dehydrogenase
MRLLVIGSGIQGNKRALVAQSDFVGFVDPLSESAHYRSIHDVNPDLYDAVAICTPNSEKELYINHSIELRKHILVEKPLIASSPRELMWLKDKAKNFGCVLYTAYNHRFEPSFILVKEYIANGGLGNLYQIRMIYGNGTAQLVKNSSWRDKGLGVIEDLVPHLIDTLKFWFPTNKFKLSLVNASAFENCAPDYAALISIGSQPLISIEVSLCAWKNTFVCDIYGEKGSAHINGLSKWGESEFKFHKRIFPSGKPIENAHIFPQGDPTWRLEYDHFKDLVWKQDYSYSLVDSEIQDILETFRLSITK